MLIPFLKIKCFMYFLKCFYYSVKWLWIQYRTENFTNYLSDIKFNNTYIAVLGNGPSLLEDIKLLSNIDNVELCAVNNFSVSKHFVELKPAFYVIIDPTYFQLIIPNDIDMQAWEELFKVNWNMYLFIPFSAIEKLKLRKDKIFDNKCISLVPLHLNEYEGFINVRKYLFRKNLSMPRAQNVLIPCIFNAINLSFEKIFLLGVDHSWTLKLVVDNSNRVCFKNEHFYDSDLPVYTPFLDTNGIQYKMHNILFDFALMFKGYNYLKEYAHEMNVHVINLTSNSFIDSFERSKIIK